MRYIARLSKLVWTVNIVLVAAVLVMIVAAIVPTRHAEDKAAAVRPPEQVQGPEAQNSGRQDQVNPKLIVERDVFRGGPGIAAEDSKKASSIPPASSKTESKPEASLRLLGTVVDEGGASYAVIENSALKSQDVYRVGDAMGDMRVDSIEQNKVVVLNAGVRQTLNLVLTGRDSSEVKAVASAPVPVAVSASSGEVMRVASATERQINMRASAANLSQATEFLRKMKLAPHETRGTPDGLAISGLEGSPLAPLTGLRDGDVVRSVNGHPVPNQAKALQVLKKARNLGSARIELMRGQEGKSLTFRTGSW